MFTNRQWVTYGRDYTFSVFPVQRLFGGTNLTGTNAYSTTNPIVVRYFTNVASFVYPIEFRSATTASTSGPGSTKFISRM